MNRTFLWPTVLALAVLAVIGAACAGDAATPQNSTVIAPSDNVLSVGIVVPGDTVVRNGWLYGDEHEVLVILSHMRGNDQTAWESFAEELADNGYAALTFDFRGHGISGGDEDFDLLDDDLAAVISFMRAKGREQIFFVGASMGGTTSLVVAAQEPVTGVVSISSPSEFQGHNARGAIGRISAPVLLIAAEDDVAAMVSLEELREAATQPSQILTYTGGEHGTALFEGEHAADVQEQIIKFLADHVN